MFANHGSIPGEARGRRVRGVLRCGRRFGFEPVGAGQQAGWAADSSRWSLEGSDFDILEWEPAQ